MSNWMIGFKKGRKRGRKYGKIGKEVADPLLEEGWPAL